MTLLDNFDYLFISTAPSYTLTTFVEFIATLVPTRFIFDETLPAIEL